VRKKLLEVALLRGKFAARELDFPAHRESPQPLFHGEHKVRPTDIARCLFIGAMPESLNVMLTQQVQNLDLQPFFRLQIRFGRGGVYWTYLLLPEDVRVFPLKFFARV